MKKLLSYIPFGKEARGTRSASVYACFFVSTLVIALLVPQEAQAGPAEAIWNMVKGVGDAAGGAALSTVSLFILGIANAILAVVGVAFNWIMLATVFQFSAYFGNSPGLLAAWTVLRDIGNIALLFGFVYIGIQTILSVDHHFSVASALPRLILVAVLMNFSLFVAQGIIDISNAVSTAIYTSAGTEQNTCVYEGEGATEFERCAVEYGISGRVMRGTGIASLFSQDGINIFSMQGAITILMAALFSTITAVVLLAAGIMLLVRGITLTFLMVMSPLAFAAMALPPFSEKAGEWWNGIFKQAFFAPAFLLMIFISLKIAEGFSTNNSNGVPSLIQGLNSGNASAMGVIFIYMLVIGFMVYSLILAKNFGAFGAGFATKTAGGMVFGLQARVARRTGGRLARAGRRAVLSNRQVWKRIPGGTAAAMRTSQMLKGVSGSSMDMRGKLGPAGALSKATGLDFGSPKAGGIDKIISEEAKRKATFAKEVGLNKREQDELKDIKKELEELNKNQKEEMRSIDERYRQQRKDINDQVAAQEAIVNNPSTSQTQKDAARKELERLAKLRTDFATAYSADRTELTEAHKEAKEGLEKSQKDLEGRPKKEMIEKYEKESKGWMAGTTVGTLTAPVAKETVKLLRKNPDKIQDAIDELNKQKKEKEGGGDKKGGEGKKDSHGGDHH